MAPNLLWVSKETKRLLNVSEGVVEEKSLSFTINGEETKPDEADELARIRPLSKPKGPEPITGKPH